jgi:molybdopterin molybdotransferase
MSQILDRHLPEEAFAWTEAFAPPGEVETVLLGEAAGRILARDLRTDEDIPASNRAAIDGFALRSMDTVGAGDYAPLPLDLRPGASGLAQGQARPVASGEPLPEGADAVLPLEFGDAFGLVLSVAAPLAPGDGVAQAGEECRGREILLAEGRRLRPQDLARVALAGYGEVPVWRKPAVRVLLAGRFERDADGPMLANLIARDGGVIESLGAAPDAAFLATALGRPGADLVLVAGGTGEGEEDHAVAGLARAGLVQIRRVAIHPGDSVALGRAGATPVVLLPGPPLACFAAYDLLAARLLRRLARLPGPWPYRSRVLPLAGKIASAIGRMDLCRVRVREGLVGEVEPLAVADERILATVVRADGFVLVPQESEGYPRGAEVLVHFYE